MKHMGLVLACYTFSTSVCSKKSHNKVFSQRSIVQLIKYTVLTPFSPLLTWGLAGRLENQACYKINCRFHCPGPSTCHVSPDICRVLDLLNPRLVLISLWTWQICVLLALHQLTCAPTLSPLPATSKRRALGEHWREPCTEQPHIIQCQLPKHLNTLWFWRPRQCPNITNHPCHSTVCKPTDRGQQSTCGHIIKTYRTNCPDSGHSKNNIQRENSHLHFPGNEGEETLGKKWIPYREGRVRLSHCWGTYVWPRETIPGPGFVQ